jgi:osmotically inducible protein OsmC
MPIRKASAVWKGKLKDGRGTVKLGSGLFEGPYSFSSRFEEGPGTNPDELLAAAHASCFSMALSGGLAQAGFAPTSISTTAQVTIALVGQGFKITRIDLDTEAVVPGIEAARFQEQAELAKVNCPVSQALRATEITLRAKLVS